LTKLTLMSGGSVQQPQPDGDRSEPARLSAILESLEEGLIVLDRDGAVTTANQNAADLLGVSLESLYESGIGRPVVGAFLEDGTPLEVDNSLAVQVLADGAEIRDVAIRLVRPDGSERWVSANYLPLRGAEGELPEAVIWSLTDVTESRRVATELAETESRLRDIAENVRAVFWIRNTRTNEVLYVSPAYEEIWGLGVDELYRDAGAWLHAIHPDDRDRVMEAALESDDSGEYDAEYRIVRPDGTTRRIHDRAFSLRSSVERGEIVSGMAEDVTARHDTEAALADALGRARAAFVHTPIGSTLFSFGTDGPPRLIEANPALCALLGHSAAELEGMTFDRIVHPDDLSDRGQWRRLAAGEIDSYDDERRLLRADGHAIWARLRVSLIRTPGGDPAYGVAQIEDITSLKLANARQDAVARLSREALEGAGVEQLMQGAIEAIDGVLGSVITGILEHLPATDELVPRATGDAPRVVVTDVRSPARSPQLRAALAERRPVVVTDWESETRFEPSDFVRRLQARSSVAVPIQGPDGPWGVMCSHCRMQRAFAPDEVSFVQAVANVLGAGIQRRMSEEDARHRALHDPLTGLPNRTLLLDRLGHALSRASRAEGELALLFLDLDHFKVINDSLGHEAGDRLLCAFAPRLQETLRPSDTVARFGGDEFVVLCEDLPSPQDAAHLAERILDSLREPFEIGSHELFTSATIGLALARENATAEGLIRDADAAMYRAKGRGRGRYELFDQAMRERVSTRLRTETALRRAVAGSGLSLAFQPIVALDDRSIVGAEALLRWDDPELGSVQPDRFIPIAEESGLIVPIGEWVLEEAARLALAWPEPASGAPLPHVSVNLSARQVAHPGFSDRLAAMLERTGLPPGRLSLEITESVLMEEAEAPMEAVRTLKALGVSLVLDDFGTGYSSLSYLNRLPIDVLKLDRSFIAPLRDHDGHTTSAIVSGMVTMAEALGMTVVAEGVEDHAQVEKLRALGCDFAQGFLFARPLPAPELHSLLRNGALPWPPADPQPHAS
jgi:diguanylate cyclase (GGDEF)-like protein/PAS domain S-box-containing protein